MPEYPELKELDEFLAKLKLHAERKAEFYDGSNKEHTPDRALRFAIEELGEVSGAITRQRWELAKSECLDSAHCAYLIYNSIVNGVGQRK